MDMMTALKKKLHPKTLIGSLPSGMAITALASSVVIAFLPLFRIELDGSAYRPSGLRLLLSALQVRDQVVAYPLSLRLAMALFFAAMGLALLLALLRRWRPAALAAVSGTALTLLLRILIGEIAAPLQVTGVQDVSIVPQLSYDLMLLLPFVATLLLLAAQGSEPLAKVLFQASASVSVASVALITAYMVVSGLPALLKIGIFPFLFGTVWQPTNAASPQFGILPMILATLAATTGAVMIGVPIGLLTATFLAEIAPRRLVAFIRPAIELLAGIPSVIYGFFGLQLLVPQIQKIFGLPTGATLFSAIVILAIMILPTLISTAETGLRAVPAGYREASLAIGATRVATIFKVTIPAARSAILSGVVLSVGRAIGETMAVIMVAGNVPNLPRVFGAVRPLTVGIALEMSYASGLHREALFAIGLVLFCFIMLVNLSFGWISRKGVQFDGKNA
jgi:phosphate ABC transporter permease protein PstC